MKSLIKCAALFVLVAASLPLSARADQKSERGVWVEAYQSSPGNFEYKLPPDSGLPEAAAAFLTERPPVDGTIRSRFAVAAAGRQVRIRISNEEGETALSLTAASVGLAADGFNAVAGSIRPLTFGGRRNVVIPAGAPMLSDPVDLPVSRQTVLVVSTKFREPFQLKPFGSTLMSVAPGDQTGNERFEQAQYLPGRPPASGAVVLSAKPQRVVIALGDSITDGARSQPEESRGWPEELQHRLDALKQDNSPIVLNAGIGGNRVLGSGWGKAALSRLNRDVLSVDGVTHIIVLEGINDIGQSGKTVFGDNPPLTSADLIGGYRQIIARAHARHVKVIIGTIMPFDGAMYFTPEKEKIRQAANLWIRTSGEPDAVIDFDMATRDPKKPSMLLEKFDTGDRLHPNAAGYKAMAEAIPLHILN